MSGFACEILLGVRKRRQVIAAVYTDGERLLFSLMGATYVLSDPTCQLRLGVTIFRLRRVQVRIERRVVLSDYQWLSREEFREWPEGDFLQYVVRETRERRSVAGAIYLWKAWAEQRPIHTEDFQEEMRSYLDAHL